MHRLTFIVAAGLGSAAFAGDVHTRTYSAVVRRVAVVERESFTDALAALDGDTAEPVFVTNACRIDVAIDHEFFKKPVPFFASAAACKTVKPGQTLEVDYLGLANHFQLIAAKVGGTWFSLPLMRTTKATSPRVLDCLAGKREHCTPHQGAAL